MLPPSRRPQGRGRACCSTLSETEAIRSTVAFARLVRCCCRYAAAAATPRLLPTCLPRYCDCRAAATVVMRQDQASARDLLEPERYPRVAVLADPPGPRDSCARAAHRARPSDWARIPRHDHAPVLRGPPLVRLGLRGKRDTAGPGLGPLHAGRPARASSRWREGWRWLGLGGP